MTRANLNYKIDGNVYYIYYNGDQSPKGLKDWFGIGNLFYYYSENKEYNKLNKERLFSYINGVYNGYTDKDIKTRKNFTIGDLTDYSYIFDFDNNNFEIYEWDENIFKGNREEFLSYLKELK